MLAGGRGAFRYVNPGMPGVCGAGRQPLCHPPGRGCPLSPPCPSVWTVELGQALAPQVCYEEVQSLLRGLREPPWLPAGEVCSLPSWRCGWS